MTTDDLSELLQPGVIDTVRAVPGHPGMYFRVNQVVVEPPGLFFGDRPGGSYTDAELDALPDEVLLNPELRIRVEGPLIDHGGEDIYTMVSGYVPLAELTDDERYELLLQIETDMDDIQNEISELENRHEALLCLFKLFSEPIEESVEKVRSALAKEFRPAGWAKAAKKRGRTERTNP